LLELGNSLLLRRSFDDAERYASQGLDLAQRYKEKRNEARANLLLGSIYIQEENADKGAPHIDRALSFYRAGDYRREISRCMAMIGRQQLLKGDFDNALKTLDAQLQLAKRVEDPGQLAKSQAECAAALSKQDLYPQALVRYTESYELNKQLNNPLNAAYAVYNRGDMLARLGQHEAAKMAMSELSTYLSGLSADNSYKRIWGTWSHLILARMYLSQRNLQDARVECSEALADADRNDAETQAEIRATQGLVEILSGAVALGRQYCEEALKLVGTGVSEHTGNVQLALAEALLESGDSKGANVAALSAQQILSRLHVQELEWRAWLIIARANQRLGNLNDVHDSLGRARTMFEDLQRKWGDESFKSYITRQDIQEYMKQVDELSRRSN